VLNLEALPLRIECFDISNIQGQEVVGSMVVFEDADREEGALPQVHESRRRGQDDFASMREVISRRFSRLAAEPAPTSGTSRSRRRRTSS
jgi:excinuclease ABC subunit C